MPTFTPVDLDLGSLEVFNDPEMNERARAQNERNARAHHDPPQLALHYPLSIFLIALLLLFLYFYI